MSKFTQEYSVICSDIDLNSQMRPLATPTYFQDCYIRYAAQNNFATFDLEPKNILWFISDYTINLSEDLPFWSENFKVSTWISKISKLRVSVDFVYTYKGKTFAHGRCNWLMFDKIQQKPLKTDVLFRDYSLTEPPLEEPDEKIDRIETLSPIRNVKHIANMTDLDFNEHVNNRSYINIAITTASKEIQENCYIKKLSVKFMKQAYMGDELLCTSFSTHQKNEFVTKIQVGEDDICKIFTAWGKKQSNHNILDCELAIRKQDSLLLSK